MSDADESRQLFEECIQRCADSLYRVAFRLTGNHTLAGELVQETYLNAWRNIESLSDTKKMRSWMFSILRNQYTKLMRREAKMITAPKPVELVNRDDHSIERDETIRLVQRALDELDEKNKLPLLLVAMESMSVDEAASVLDLPRGTVLSRLHRGRQKLKAILNRQLSPDHFSELERDGL